MIYIGIGANLPHPAYGGPRATCGAALFSFEKESIHIKRRSRWYESAPVPPSDQPRYVNAVVSVETALGPNDLLAALLRIERAFDRIRSVKNAPRPLDLDLLDYDGRVIDGGPGLILPHPRLHERAFVLLPLADLDPAWRHPASGRDVAALIARLPSDATAVPLADGGGVYGTDWTPPTAEEVSQEPAKTED